MNKPEVTMNNVLPKNNLIATEKAVQASAEAISMARRVPAPLKSIADQVIRAASSLSAGCRCRHADIRCRLRRPAGGIGV
jgi:hypothetical protein